MEHLPPAEISYKAVPVYKVIACESASRKGLRKPRMRFRSSADVYALLANFYKMQEPERETISMLMLDAGHRVVGLYPVSTGTLNLAVVHPREVFRMALLVPGCAAIVIVHNHPSGDPAPSEEDVRMTKQMVLAGNDLGVPVLDHVIMGDGRHYSFADMKRLSS